MSDTITLIQRSQQGDRDASERLVTENTGLIWSIARRYFGRGVEPDDLFQLGCVGFLKAVEGFDTAYGTQFSTYAVPKIAGEIRRFLRDDGAVKVSRSVKERAAAIKKARERLTGDFGRDPTVSELSEALGLSPEEIAAAETANNRRYSKVNEIARYLVPLIPDGGTVMTQCFGETIVGMMLKEARQAGKTFRLFCPETRPYFQGARLTATVCHDMGFDVTVITDNMPAFVMEREHVDLFTCAADAICLDGYVVNKVGTLQIAICANHFGIPTFVTGAPDIGHETKDTVKIEMRDPEFTLQAMGVRTAAQGVKGYYPAFDMTPPHLISGIVTDRGVFSPFDLHRYFAGGGAGEYDTVV